MDIDRTASFRGRRQTREALFARLLQKVFPCPRMKRTDLPRREKTISARGRTVICGRACCGAWLEKGCAQI